MILSKKDFEQAHWAEKDMVRSHEELRGQRDRAVQLLREANNLWGYNGKLRDHIRDFLAEVQE